MGRLVCVSVGYMCYILTYNTYNTYNNVLVRARARDPGGQGSPVRV